MEKIKKYINIINKYVTLFIIVESVFYATLGFVVWKSNYNIYDLLHKKNNFVITNLFIDK